jgi:predicted nucleic acid-binding protein
MICVLDASAAIEIVMRRKDSIDFVNRLMEADEVIAPSFFCAEVANVIRKYVLFEGLEREAANRLFSAAISIVDRFVSAPDLINESFAESIRLDHPVYDMLYFVLARRNGARLISCDKRMNLLAKQYLYSSPGSK